MRRDARALLAVAVLFGLVCAPCVAEEPARTDLLGDPLPAGAVARLGSSRLKHRGCAYALVYSPDGKWLASAGADRVIRLWDADTGKPSLTLAGHQDTIFSLAFVPPGEGKPATVLVSSSDDKTIRFWDLTTGKELAYRINHPGIPWTLAVSPDGKFLASGGSESFIVLWKVEDGKEVRRWKAHRGGVARVAFAPDGRTIASGGTARKADEPGDDYGVALWETATGKPRQTFAAHTGFVGAIVFSHDGKLLASAGIDEMRGRSVLLWDPETGKQLRAVAGLSSRVGDQSFAPCLALTRDGKTMAGGHRGQIQFFDPATGGEQRGRSISVSEGIQALAFSPDGSTLASAHSDGRILLWDVARRTAKLPTHGHAQPLTSVAVAPDGKTIATTSEDGTAWLWDRATSKPVRRLKPEGAVDVGVIWCAAFSPDSRTVALAHNSDDITLWDVATGQLRRHVRQKKDAPTVCIDFSPDGKWLAAEGLGLPDTSLWSTATGELKRTYPRETNDAFGNRGASVAISPDGRLLASTADYRLYVWRLDSGKQVFSKSDTSSDSVTFSPGGFLVATAGEVVTLFDAGTGMELGQFEAFKGKSLRNHTGSRGAAFSPDGRLLAVTAGWRVKLWDVTACRELPGFEGHRGIIASVAFTPDGKAVVSASEDGTALIWDLAGVLPPVRPGDVKAQWRDLGDSDRLRVYAAFSRLRALPGEAIALLKANLKPTPTVPAERLADLIKKLDADSFEVRDQGARELKAHGLAAEKALREAARNKPSPEAAKRIDQLLAEFDGGPEWQRTQVALKLLEEMPPAKIRELVQSLAKGDPDSRLTREANALLERLPPHPEP
jgi:WD40 repeat protein